LSWKVHQIKQQREKKSRYLYKNINFCQKLEKKLTIWLEFLFVTTFSYICSYFIYERVRLVELQNSTILSCKTRTKVESSKIKKTIFFLNKSHSLLVLNKTHKTTLRKFVLLAIELEIENLMWIQSSLQSLLFDPPFSAAI
jgi:hypothetical protein